MAACMRSVFCGLKTSKSTPFKAILPAALSRQPRQLSCIVIPKLKFHTSLQVRANFDPESDWDKRKMERAFTKYNEIVYPPTEEGEDLRPAEICHVKKNIFSSAKKNWHSAVLVRGLSIDEALNQCEFSKKAFPKIMKEVLMEAQDMAVKDFNVEYKSNLWIADSYVTRAKPMKSFRRTRGGRLRNLTLHSCHYFVRLREGTPPKHYYPVEQTGQEKLEDYIRDQRKRTIKHSL